MNPVDLMLRSINIDKAIYLCQVTGKTMSSAQVWQEKSNAYLPNPKRGGKEYSSAKSTERQGNKM